MGLNLKYVDGQTPLNEEEKEGLKIKSITTQNELDEFEQLNIEKAIEWTMRVRLKPEKILSEKFIKELHKKMYGAAYRVLSHNVQIYKNTYFFKRVCRNVP